MIGLARMAWALAWTRSKSMKRFGDNPPFANPLPRFYADPVGDAPSTNYYRIIDAISHGGKP